MSVLVLDRADLWPVGTVVAAYPGHIGRGDVVTESATVASNGTVTFSSLTDGNPYVLSGTDGGGTVRRLHLRKASVFATPQTQPWKSRVVERRAAIGTS